MAFPPGRRARRTSTLFAGAAVQLAGGNIRNIVLAAAYLAAAEGTAIALRHLLRAAGREHHKMGKAWNERNKILTCAWSPSPLPPPRDTPERVRVKARCSWSLSRIARQGSRQPGGIAHGFGATVGPPGGAGNRASRGRWCGVDDGGVARFCGRILAVQSRLGNRIQRHAAPRAWPPSATGLQRPTAADRSTPPSTSRCSTASAGTSVTSAFTAAPGPPPRRHRTGPAPTPPAPTSSSQRARKRRRPGKGADMADQLADVVQQREAGAADASARAAGGWSAGALEQQAKSASSAALAGRDVGPLSPAPAGAAALGKNKRRRRRPRHGRRPHKDESLGPLDSWAADQTAGRVIGEPGGTFFREMLRGFKGGIRGAARSSPAAPTRCPASASCPGSISTTSGASPKASSARSPTSTSL